MCSIYLRENLNDLRYCALDEDALAGIFLSDKTGRAVWAPGNTSIPISRDGGEGRRMPTVFVVESNAGPRRRSLLQSVQEAGFHTLPMTDCEMALAVLHAIRADLLVVDVTDESAGGSRLIAQIRQNEMLRQMPILAVGACGTDDTFRQLSRSVGVGGVLADGAYSEQELIHEVRKYLAKAVSPLPSGTSYQWTN
jgi:CheY-like chemotaxis protein